MGKIRVLALGAGQDVGRSCIVVDTAGTRIMFDCGMHMGYNDHQRFPDFTLLSPNGGNERCVDVDAVIISHFHLDHCGALPYLWGQCGWRGPVIMTHPTRTLAHLLLEDYRKICAEGKGDQGFFDSSMIEDVLSATTCIALGESLKIGENIEVNAMYAGHVLGAAMFHVRNTLDNSTILYTGDYNLTTDRHLAAATPPFAQSPTLLITESTYACTMRTSKRSRERSFLNNVLACCRAGGKVLVPVFALGRVQELCCLLEDYWERAGLRIPIYYGAGMAEMATKYYQCYVEWGNESTMDAFTGVDTEDGDNPINTNDKEKNRFNWKRTKVFQSHHALQPGPCVLFSSPGMLHSGASLEIFKEWCTDPLNMLIIPGFCASGTVGAQLLAGKRLLQIDEKTFKVRMQVENLSFSAHADAHGIMQLISESACKHVCLVHGEAGKMSKLKERIEADIGVPCYMPANGESFVVCEEADEWVDVCVDVDLIGEHGDDSNKDVKDVWNINDNLAILTKQRNNHQTQPQFKVEPTEWKKKIALKIENCTNEFIEKLKTNLRPLEIKCEEASPSTSTMAAYCLKDRDDRFEVLLQNDSQVTITCDRDHLDAIRKLIPLS